jgi:hypothetical protein
MNVMERFRLRLTFSLLIYILRTIYLYPLLSHLLVSTLARTLASPCPHRITYRLKMSVVLNRPAKQRNREYSTLESTLTRCSTRAQCQYIEYNQRAFADDHQSTVKPLLIIFWIHRRCFSERRWNQPLF